MSCRFNELPLHQKSHNFWQKGKVTISVMDYICRIKDLIKTNNWLDTAAYNNLANASKGTAQKWIFSMEYMEEDTMDQLQWADFKHLFLRNFCDPVE
jgi:hypothetical protein